MKKLLSIFFICFTSSLWSYAQEVTKINLDRSEKIIGLPEKGLLRVITPTFSQKGSTLSADSANFNQAQNTFDAFGNVVITQSDGTRVYSDLLNYNGNNRLALLTRNVRMVDKDAVLTTDVLTYNMENKVGTYTGGGKIVNGKNVLTSKNGQYFANSRDAYFKYNVVLTSPDAVIKSDTLRYNSGSKIAFFYGPTNIYSKDSTVLYTENGQHNTVNEQSRFGRKNLLTQGSKSLTGDSLYYDGKADRGRAVRNITFIDTAQQFTLKGNKGIYKKADESILVTNNAYVIITTEPDSAKVDSIYMTADTLFSKVVLKKSINIIGETVVKKDSELEDPQVSQPSADKLGDDEEEDIPDSLLKAKSDTTSAMDDPVKKTPADTLKKKPAVKSVTDSLAKDSTENKIIGKETPTDSTKIRSDTVSAAKTPVKKEGFTDSLKQQAPSAKADTSVKSAPEKVKTRREQKREDKKLAKAKQREGRKKVTDRVKTEVAKAGQDSLASDSIKLVTANDTTKAGAPPDTAKTRIVLAYNNAKIFKSDLQAKADSLFFSYADSTIRCYINPMVWTQDSQMSADTIYMQLKDKKLDNMLLQHDGFIVNTEADSTKFNQVKGKLITGYFEDSKLNRMFVDGNAESLYYTKEDSVYNGMNKTVSGRIKILFQDNNISQIIPIRKAAGSYFPIEKVTEDIGILEGFIWKPKDRPVSKEAIISSSTEKDTAKKPPAKTSAKVKMKPSVESKGKPPAKRPAPVTLKPAAKKQKPVKVVL